MRGQDRFRLSAMKTVIAAIIAGTMVLVSGAIYAQSVQTTPRIVPRVTGAAQPMGDVPAPPFPRPVTDDKRVMRNYPEQPPVIPHSIENYQLTLRANRCLDCHRREYTEGSGAPMISVTHFMDSRWPDARRCDAPTLFLHGLPRAANRCASAGAEHLHRHERVHNRRVSSHDSG